MESKRIFGLDVVRTIAILMVVICHLVQISWINSYFGFAGVEIFFVLSGFLIGGIILSMPNYSYANIKKFWIRRWWRTLPNYYLILAIIIIVKKAYYYNVFLTFGLFLQNIISGGNTFFPISWSLGIEEWFYIIFPLLLLGASKLFKNRKKTIILALIILFALPLLLRIYITFTGWSMLNWSDTIRKMVILRIDSIGVGVIGIGLFNKNKENILKIKNKIMLISLIFFIFLSYLYQYKFVSNLFYNSSFTILFSLSILGMFPFFYSLKPRMINFFELTSKISYSMYLNHIYIILFFNYAWYSIFFIYLISYIQYQYFELPLTKMRDKK